MNKFLISIRQRFSWFQNIIIYNPVVFAVFGFITGIFIMQENLDLWYLVLLFVFIGLFLFITFKRSIVYFVIFVISFILIVIRFKAYVSTFDNYTDKSNVQFIRVLDIQERGDNQKIIGYSEDINQKILIKLSRYPEVRVGDFLYGEFQLQIPKSSDDFDYRFYLRTQGISYISNSYNFHIINHKSSLYSLIYNLKFRISSKLRSEVPEPYASLIAGILWGEKADMPKEFSTNLSRTGTTHIIAVSGFNVSVIVLFTLKLAGLLPRRLIIVVISLMLAIFLIFVGISNIPAIRAGIMGFIVLVARSIGRKISLVSLLSLSILILSLINPFSIFTVSFQLSFAALIGLLGFADIFNKLFHFIPEIIRTEFSATLSAILFTTPITLYNFSTFSFVAPVVNLLVLPVITLLMLIGFIELVMILLSSFFAKLFLFITIPSIDYVLFIITKFGEFPYASFNLHISKEMFTLVYIFLFFAFFEVQFRNYEKKCH